MSAEALTFTEFARRVGVSRPRISQLVGEGRLPVVDGPRKNQRLIPWGEGLEAWRADRGDVAVAGVVSSTATPAPSAPSRAPSRPRSTSSESKSEATAIALRLASARAKDKALQAEHRRLDLERKQGSLIPAEEVRAEAEERATTVRAALLAVPARVSLALVGRTAAEIEVIIGDEIAAVVAKLTGG